MHRDPYPIDYCVDEEMACQLIALAKKHGRRLALVEIAEPTEADEKVCPGADAVFCGDYYVYPHAGFLALYADLWGRPCSGGRGDVAGGDVETADLPTRAHVTFLQLCDELEAQCPTLDAEARQSAIAHLRKFADRLSAICARLRNGFYD